MFKNGDGVHIKGVDRISEELFNSALIDNNRPFLNLNAQILWD
jgi:hypothetical protein